MHITGLQNRPELNGLEGRILGFDEGKGRYSVQLTRENRTLQLKPANLIVGSPSAAPATGSDDSSFSLITLDDHSALTPAQVARAVELLQGGKASQLELGLLLRCLVCYHEWVVPVVRKGDSSPMFYTFPVPPNQVALAIFSTEQRLDAFRPQFQIEQQGVELCGAAMPGHQVFSATTSEVTVFLMDFDATQPARGPCSGI